MSELKIGQLFKLPFVDGAEGWRLLHEIYQECTPIQRLLHLLPQDGRPTPMSPRRG